MSQKLGGILRGLVLSGGKSKRMGSPKAEIAYHGKPEYERCCELLNTVCDEVYLSTSEFWSPSNMRLDFVKKLPDPKAGSIGPLSGMASAFTMHAASAWIVLACDMPFFDAKALEQLCSNRDMSAQATCFRGYQGRPEPLCAIYEPSAGEEIVLSFMQEKNCPRQMLERMNVRLLEPDDKNWVRNVNSKEEYDTREEEQLLREKIEIEVYFVAQLREIVGRPVARITTQQRTLRRVYEELRRIHGFALQPQHMRVAVNDEFVDWDADFKANDRVMFVPPVAGG